LIGEKSMATMSIATLGMGASGLVMQNIFSALEKARSEGAAAGEDRTKKLDDCPYGELDDPMFRAIWQDAFATSRLYGDA
jgi:hypothetical protein